jgi:hypothetical protein
MVIYSLEGWKFVKVTLQSSGSDFKFKMDIKDSTTSENVFDSTISGVSFTGDKSIYINSDTNGSTGASMYVNEVWWYDTISVSSEFDSIYTTTSTRQASTCVSSPSIPCMGDSLYTDKNSDDEYCTGACSICYSNPSTCIVCRNDCLLGCYDFSSPKCILCPTKCSSCDVNTLKCICHSSASLSGNTCVCPSGYEESSSNPVQCIPIVCNQKCTCSSNSNPCTGCVSHSSLVVSACQCDTNYVEDPSNSNACVLKAVCADDQYVDAANTCQACPVGCKSCILDASANLVCDDCQDTYYLDIHQTCKACPNSCISCSLNASNTLECYECSSNLYLQPAGSITLCDNSCPDSYYTDKSANWSCKPCISNCKTCTNSQNCETCMNSYYRLASEDSAACYSTCPDGFYPEGSECVPCYMENCTLCRSNIECIICDSSYYLSSVTLTCLPCIDNCDICTTQSDCLQCSPSYYINSSDDDVVCVLDCTEKCIECSINTRCNICEDGYYILSQVNYDTCEKGCPEGYYESKLDAWKCIECTYGCKSCLTSSICTSCIDGYILEGDSCVCSEGYYMESTTHICQACPMYCKACEISKSCKECSSNTVCTFCEDGYYILTENDFDMCVRVCPVGYYESRSDPWTCKECPYLCKSCLSSSRCTSCIEGYVLDGDSCVCSEGYYMESTTNICKPCPNLCTTCQKSQSSLECTSCVDFSYLNSSSLCRCYTETSQSSSECPKTCPQAMQINSSNTSCISKPSQSTNSRQEDDVEQAITVLTLFNFAAFSLSHFANNPSLWIMINAIQLLSFMPLLQVDMPLFLDSGLKAQVDYYLSYNLLSEISHSDIKPFEKAYEFKYKNSNFIMNIGKPVFLLCIVIVVHLICYIGGRYCKGKMKVYLNRLHDKFYYEVYIIYFIEMYLEILVPAFLQCIYV